MPLSPVAPTAVGVGVAPEGVALRPGVGDEGAVPAVEVIQGAGVRVGAGAPPLEQAAASSAQTAIKAQIGMRIIFMTPRRREKFHRPLKAAVPCAARREGGATRAVAQPAGSRR
ncbi:MAG TPA: hypothetical protein VFC53_11895 [Dehalococcoidia bacterium]|nr:hypothetical protein [Dehalococcoidia bacterium]